MTHVLVKIGIVMGSTSDWPVMQHAANTLQKFNLSYNAQVVSAHRMPDEMLQYAANAQGIGLQAIIAGAGGAAHLPGMLASKTWIPVLGVPIANTDLHGQDALFSIVQMPRGVPVATFAIGQNGAVNAALYAIAILALHDQDLAKKLQNFRCEQNLAAKASVLPPSPSMSVKK